MISDAAVTSDVYVILIEFFYIVLLMDTHTAYGFIRGPAVLRTHFGGPAGARAGHEIKNRRRQYGGDVRYPPYCARRFSIGVTARPPAGPPFSAFRAAVGTVGSLLAIHPWMPEEIVKPLLHFSSFRVGHSRVEWTCCARPF